ncbi:hypothetical protein JCM10212_007088 [Sporobolomyces blumeae]
MTVPTIHLAPLHPADSPSPSPALSHKDSYLAPFADAAEPVEPKRRSGFEGRVRRPRLRWNADLAETILWASVPLVLHGLAIVLMTAVVLSNGPRMAFMSVSERGGTGKLEYFVLNSCAIAPGSTTRTCTSRSLVANFLPSLTTISPDLPGFSALKLPFYSHQTPSIMLSGLVLLVVSLLVYLPLWTLVYFPNAPVPGPVVRFIRYRAKPLFCVSGVLTFLGFVFALSIGIGYKLYMMGFRQDFHNWYRFGVYASGTKDLRWHAELGPGFDAIWASTVCSALTVVGINISLHNGLDERVEWPKDAKENLYGSHY